MAMAFSSSTAAFTTFTSGRCRTGACRPNLSSSFLNAFPRVVTARSAPAPRVAAVTVRAQAAGKKSVPIVNTNGGGHAVIGFYFAKDLLAAGHAVTVLTVGEEDLGVSTLSFGRSIKL